MAKEELIKNWLSKIYNFFVSADLPTETLQQDILTELEKKSDLTETQPVSIQSPLESNGAMPVNIQDQHSEIIDLHLSRLIQLVTIAINTTINDTTVTITSTTEPVDGNILCLKEGTSFYQGEILSHIANGSDWDVVLDTPLDFAFTTIGGCSERNINLNVDGSITPIEFILSPSNLTPGTRWDIVRIIFQITDDTSMDDAKFGGISALSKGIVLRSENGIVKNIFNAKTNGDMGVHMYDINYSDKAPAGFFGFRARRTFGGQSKNGVTIRLETDTNDELKIIVQDNLIGLFSFRVVAQGHIVQD